MISLPLVKKTTGPPSGGCRKTQLSWVRPRTGRRILDVEVPARHSSVGVKSQLDTDCDERRRRACSSGRAVRWAITVSSISAQFITHVSLSIQSRSISIVPTVQCQSVGHSVSGVRRTQCRLWTAISIRHTRSYSKRYAVYALTETGCRLHQDTDNLRTVGTGIINVRCLITIWI